MLAEMRQDKGKGRKQQQQLQWTIAEHDKVTVHGLFILQRFYSSCDCHDVVCII